MANDVVVGFIGLGTMGGKMATNILKAGYKVVVHDLHRQSAGHHLQAGAEWADTPRDAGREVRRDLHLAARADGCRARLAGDRWLDRRCKKGRGLLLPVDQTLETVVKKIHEAFGSQGRAHATMRR